MLVMGMVAVALVLERSTFQEQIDNGEASLERIRGSKFEQHDLNDEVAVWLQQASKFRFAESVRAEFLNVLPHPRGKELCFVVCGEEICESEFHSRTDRTWRNPRYKGQCKTTHALPSFATVGFSQSGSTFFYSMLCSGKEIVHAKKKEIHFFDVDMYRSFREGKQIDLEVYLENFDHFSEKGTIASLIGDNTVKSIYVDLWIPLWKRILNPEMKILILVRDPIRRVQSRFAMTGGSKSCSKYLKKKRDCKRSLDSYLKSMFEHLALNCPNLKAGGDPSEAYSCTDNAGAKFLDGDTLISTLYEQFVRHWLNFFRGDQFLVIQAENLFADPSEVMSIVGEFLGVNFEAEKFRLAIARALNHKNSHDKSSAQHLSSSMENHLISFFKPYVLELRRIIEQEMPHIPPSQIPHWPRYQSMFP